MKYAKIDKNSGIVHSVEDYSSKPQVADHERTSIEYVEINENQSQNVQVGHPLPAEARKQGGQPGHGGDPGHQGQGQGQAGAPGQQPGQGGGSGAQPKNIPSSAPGPTRK